jgi:replicative DNA helicase
MTNQQTPNERDVRRQLLALANQIEVLAYDETRSTEAVFDEAADATLTFAAQHTSRPADTVQPVPTGLADVDRLLSGLQPGALTLVAARPGLGKHSFLTTVALNAARRAQRVMFFNLELTIQQQMDRLAAAESGIPVHRLRTRRLTPAEQETLLEAIERLDTYPLHLETPASLSPTQLRVQCWRWRLHMQAWPDLVIVSDTHRLTAPADSDARGRDVAGNLTRLARELNAPVLATAQVSRSVEARLDKRPRPADLCDGALAQSADVVMCLYRDEVYDENTEKPDIAEVIVAKHRNGPTGMAEIVFNKELLYFTDLGNAGQGARG